MSRDPGKRLAVEAAASYRAADRYAWHFARGKLGGDPVFRTLLREGLLPPLSNILDLGCGQGLLASWLGAASRFHAAGDWPPDWPPPPSLIGYHGIDLMHRDVARARLALSAPCRVEQGDIRQSEFGHANVVVILDVLHYLDEAAQRAVLARARSCLEPAGVLLLRVGDAAAGLPFRITMGVDRCVIRLRGQSSGRLYCRSLAAWEAELTALGFAWRTLPMSAGTPFANHLLIAVQACAPP